MKNSYLNYFRKQSRIFCALKGTRKKYYQGNAKYTIVQLLSITIWPTTAF